MPTPNVDRLDERLMNMQRQLQDIAANVQLLVANNHSQDVRLSLLEEKQSSSNKKFSTLLDGLWKIGLSVATGYLLWKLGLPIT